jgi:hypothetical protein
VQPIAETVHAEQTLLELPVIYVGKGDINEVFFLFYIGLLRPE